MIKKIKVSKDSYIIFFQNIDFWNKILAKSVSSTKKIDIVTYNFNFVDYGNNSFCRKIFDLINHGCCVRLIYAKNNSNDLVNSFINKFGIVGKLEENHSKLFLADNFAFVGSSNFTFHSNSNIECGFITTNKQLIKEIRKNLLSIYYEHNDFKWITLPEDLPFFEYLNDFEIFLDLLKSLKRNYLKNKNITQNLYLNICQKKPTNMFKSLKFEIDEDWDNFTLCLNCLNFKRNTRVAPDNTLFASALDNLIINTENYLEAINYIINRGGIIRLYFESGLIKEDDMKEFFTLTKGNY